MAYREDDPFLPIPLADRDPGIEGAPPADDMLRLVGAVEHLIYCNEDNGYAVFDFGVDDSGEVITAQGILPYISEGDALILWGQWIHNPKYGRQFKVAQYAENSARARPGAYLRLQPDDRRGNAVL